MNTRPGSAIVLATALASAAISLAACGAAANPTAAPTAGSPTPWPRVTCAQTAPASVVGQALGLSVADPQETHQDPVTVCTYLVKSKNDAVVLRFQTGANQDVFASGKSGYATGTTDVTGFQDGAYSSVAKANNITTNTLAAIKGTVEIVVTSTATIDQEKALETQLFTTLQ
jgi:hypothetical protein